MSSANASCRPAEERLLDSARGADRAAARARGRAPRVAAVGRAGQSVSRRDAAVHAAPPPADGGLRRGRWSPRAATCRTSRCARRTRGAGAAGGIADLFLVHDRPIVRHVDDSIVRVMLGRELVLRRARGYAPLPVPAAADGAAGRRRRRAPEEHRGGHVGRECRSSASTSATSRRRGVDGVPSRCIAQSADAVPRRARRGRRRPASRLRSRRRHARALGCRSSRCSTISRTSRRAWPRTTSTGRCWACPGTARATARTARSGAASSCGRRRRVDRARGCLRPFRLPGGERAIREPRRSALGAASRCHGRALARRHRRCVDCTRSTPASGVCCCRRSTRGVNAPVTTSAGRLFDAVASLVGSSPASGFEGQAAMELECAVDDGRRPAAIPFDDRRAARPFAISAGTRRVRASIGQPMIRAILADVARGVRPAIIAARFHDTLAEIIVAVAQARRSAARRADRRLLSESPLTERAVAGCARAGFAPCWHQRVPPNDGGIALGQIAAFARASLHRAPRPARCRTTSPRLCERHILIEEVAHVPRRSRTNPRHRRRRPVFAQRPRRLRRHRQARQLELRARGARSATTCSSTSASRSRRWIEAEAAKVFEYLRRWASWPSSRRRAVMKFIDEYRDARRRPAYARAPSRAVTTRPWTLMEVCGGQTHAIVKFGVDELLPPEVTLVHGPGCPVCVTPLELIEKAHRDRVAARRDLLLVRRHAARAGPRERSAVGQGAAAATSASSIRRSTRCRSRATNPGSGGRVLRRRLRDHGARPTRWRCSRRREQAHRELLDARVARAGAAGDGGDPRRRPATACRGSWPPGTSAR